MFSYSVSAQAPSPIDRIRQAVHKINTDTGYTVKTLDQGKFLADEVSPDNGAELAGYFKNSRLVKMVERIGLSSCTDVTEFYVLDGELIFTYTAGSVFPYIDSLQRFDFTKPDKTMECRFYFDKGRMFRSILKGSTRCGGEPTDELAAIYLKEYAKYKILFARK